eukprot:scaffold80008_cov47-Attheya_sp.AAC.1
MVNLSSTRLRKRVPQNSIIMDNFEESARVPLIEDREAESDFRNDGIGISPNNNDDVETNTKDVYEDNDDSSSSSSSPSAISMKDMKWSMSSNGLFFVGSAIQVGVAAYDVRDYRQNPSSLNDDYDDYDDKQPFVMGFAVTVYNALSFFAAFTFIMNAVIDVAWARNDMHGQKTTRFNKDTRVAMAVAILFGIGALFENLSLVFSNDDRASAALTLVATHTYLLSGIITVRSTSPSCADTSVALATSGNILFLAGSLIDAIISYVGDPDIIEVNVLVLASWNLVSSILWLLDAILYILADLVQLSMCSKMATCFNISPHRIRSLFGRQYQPVQDRAQGHPREIRIL